MGSPHRSQGRSREVVERAIKSDVFKDLQEQKLEPEPNDYICTAIVRYWKLSQ
jgi:hypothetical protein